MKLSVSLMLFAVGLSDSLFADFHLRKREDYFTNFSSSIARLGVTYYANDNLKLTVGYHVSKSDNVQFGYRHQFIQLPSGNNYRNVHSPRVTYFHNLDLRKK